jgi:hypothetical protein
MAVVVVAEIPGATQDFYDKVTENAMEGDSLPDGCQTHIAGPIDGGWRVITVWDSEDAFHNFRNDTLIPALRSAGAGDEAIAASPQARPVYRYISA